MDPTQAALLRRLQEAGRPVIVVSYGSPYLLAQVPELPVYVCAYGGPESSQRAAVAALLGEFADRRAGCRSACPACTRYGHGAAAARDLTCAPRPRPRRPASRPRASPRSTSCSSARSSSGPSPAAVVAVGRRGRLAHLRAFGRLSYDADAAPVTIETLYDLASLTKVVATTTLAMTLVDDGRLDLDKRVADFLPRFQGAGKEKVTVRHLLTHSSGIDWWAPLYKEAEGPGPRTSSGSRRCRSSPSRARSRSLQRPGHHPAGRDPGTGGRAAARRAGAGALFEPLGLRAPPTAAAALLPRIAPTENDPWRGRVLRGEVHDENAFALGGVAPHAGLFSTAPDLARFAQMLLNGGVYEHHRIVSRAPSSSSPPRRVERGRLDPRAGLGHPGRGLLGRRR